MPKFENVSCSQCGESFGPGDAGFSRCDRHKFVLRDNRDNEMLRISINNETGYSEIVVMGGTERVRSVMVTDHADLINLRNWLERNLGCLYDQGSPEEEPIADGERG